MGGHHHHHHVDNKNSSRLFVAILVNLFLSLVQFLVGIFTGSLSLIADSVHNLGDVGSLIIAYFAQKISGLKPTKQMTYGFERAEVIGALINSILLIATALFLIFEAYERIMSPRSVEGFWVIIVGTLAFVIDLFTAFITHKGAKNSVNMRAAFIHNLSDALASVGVIVSGVFAMYFQIYWVDILATLCISIFILFHAYPLLKSCLKILMQSAPEDLDIESLKEKILSLDKITSIDHLHVWQLSDSKKMMEITIKVKVDNLEELETLKGRVKATLRDVFGINHTTLEVSLD